jgi:uncharacterized membrane protein (UPF0182 family)
MQVEARIDQNPDISKLFTLWGQVGSSIIRGNLLVIPIGGNIIYVEPIYLKAEKSHIPELRSVIVSYNDVIVMKPNLEMALNEMLGERIVEMKNETFEDLIVMAIEYYKRAIENVKIGNWSGFGENLERLGETLERLNTSVNLRPKT